MRVLAFSVVALAGLSSTTLAVDVYFDGEVATSCSIEGHADGDLAVDVNDGTVMSSDVTGGTAGSVSLRSTGGYFVNVAAPQLTLEGDDYDGSSDTLLVRYDGEDGLASITQAWTAAGTSKAVSTPLTSDLVVHNRITNPAGFPVGTYQTLTVVTCTPTAAFP